jgi:hypothetical protein
MMITWIVSPPAISYGKQKHIILLLPEEKKDTFACCLLLLPAAHSFKSCERVLVPKEGRP